MKNFKRITAVVLAFVIIALTLPTITVFAADADARYGRTKLTADQQYVYDALVTGCKDAKADIKIDISGKSIDFNKDLSFIFNMFYSDYPEYFWVTNGWSAGAEQSGSKITLTMQPTYSFTGSALTSAKSAYNAKVDELSKGLSGKSDYEKSKIIHDRLIDTVTYVSTNNDQNAYGALVEGKAVCNGYARAYQHLMNKAGIPTWFVRGSSINPSTGAPIGHAWNIVKLDGKWYYTDVTWDDQGENTFYEYLNITTSKMKQGHALDAKYEKLVPQATATDANFYKKENREFSGYDQARLVELLKKDNNKTQIYITGNINSFLNSVGTNLLTIGEQLGGKGAFTVSYSASTLQNALILNVVVVSENHTHKTKTTVKQVNATCLSNGTKAYYVCDCGLKFSDSACTKQISSDSELEIPALSHTPSGWKNDATNHWKECTKCGSETANTRGSHADKNKDYKCDTCGYGLPKPDQSGNVVIGGGTAADNTSSNNSSGNANTTPSTPSTPTTSSKDETPTTSVDDTSSETESKVETDVPNNDTTTDNDNVTQNETIEEIIYEDEKPNGDAMTWILICGAAALVITAGIVITVVIVKKK